MIGITYLDLFAQSTLSPELLIRGGLVKTAADCAALGLNTMPLLLKHLGRPTETKHWFRTEHEWNVFVISLESPPFHWSPTIWLSVAAELKPRDVQALGVSLDQWFAQSPDLMAEAKKTASQWLLPHSQERWAKYAGLSAATFALLTSKSSTVAGKIPKDWF